MTQLIVENFHVYAASLDSATGQGGYACRLCRPETEESFAAKWPKQVAEALVRHWVAIHNSKSADGIFR